MGKQLQGAKGKESEKIGLCLAMGGADEATVR